MNLIRLQVNPVKNIGRRLSFYKSKLIVGQIAESEAYNVIQKVICICITEYPLFPKVKEYINYFRFYNPKNNLYFEDIPEEIFTIELPKLPVQSDGTNGWNWVQFLRSKTKEEFEMVAAQNPEIRKAVNTLYELSADAKVRAEYEQRLKAFRDRKNEFDGLLLDMQQETARKLKSVGTSIEQIAYGTGLTIKQIEEL